MRTLNWIVLALVVLTMTAVAQQAASAPQNPQPVSASQTTPSQPAAPATLGPPTTMDQVVDRAIAREKELVKMLTSRTPLVETYLQNLTQDPQLGPIPQEKTPKKKD